MVTAERRVARYASGVLELEGLSDRNDAETLKAREVFVKRDALHVDEGELLLVDLLGAPVFHVSGAALGTVENIGDNGAQPLLIVKTPRGEVMVPFVDAFVRRADKERIELDPPSGLFDDDAVLDEEREQ